MNDTKDILNQLKKKFKLDLNIQQNIDGFSIILAPIWKRILANVLDFLIVFLILCFSILIFFGKDLAKLKIIEETQISVSNIQIDNNKQKLISLDIAKKDELPQQTQDNLENTFINENKKIFEKILNSRLLKYIFNLFPLLYFLLFSYKQHATIGQKIFNLQLISVENKNLIFSGVLNRTFIFFICFFILFPFLLFIFFIIPLLLTANKLTLHDIVSKTRIIEIKKI